MLFLAPTLGLIALFRYYPMLVAFLNSTQTFDWAGNAAGFIGLDNFSRVLQDPVFIQGLKLTLLFFIVKLPLQLLLGLVSALLAVESNFVNNLLRSSICLPIVIPIVVASVIFGFLFDSEIGIVNAFLGIFDVEKVRWLFKPATAQIVVLLLSLWRDAGFVMLIFLTGLQSIPGSLLEAAHLDGSNTMNLLRYIIVPLLKRSFQLATVLITLSAFQYFAPVFVVTRGGPQGSTMLASYVIYGAAFHFYDMGGANAMSLIVVLILVIVTLIELRLLRTNWEY